MSLKKCIGLVTMAIVGGAFAVGCSSSDTAGGTTGDGGTTVADTGVRRDTGPTTEDAGNTADAAGTCTPQPVAGYTPLSYPSPIQQAACSDAETTAIANDCAADGTAAACVADVTGKNAAITAACLACAVSAETATTWGPFVRFVNDGGPDDVVLQNAGCIDLVTGVKGCGEAYYGVVNCINASCSDASCGTDPNAEPAASCGNAAIKSVCKPYLVTQACGTGLQKPEVDTKCFGASITAVAKSILTLNCSTKPTADAGPG
jgi:hypothetical protein